jgi:cytochrome b pre-mRNA-processing protein 6
VRALNHWPVDVLRPSISFQTSIRNSVDARFLDPSRAGAAPQTNVKANEAFVNTPEPFKAPSEKEELEKVNVLYSLLENRYYDKVRLLMLEFKLSEQHLFCFQYPLSTRTLQPASNPGYYADLLTELEEAPTRSWFGRFINGWKGFVRLS